MRALVRATTGGRPYKQIIMKLNHYPKRPYKQARMFASSPELNVRPDTVDSRPPATGSRSLAQFA